MLPRRFSLICYLPKSSDFIIVESSIFLNNSGTHYVTLATWETYKAIYNSNPKCKGILTDADLYQHLNEFSMNGFQAVPSYPFMIVPFIPN